MTAQFWIGLLLLPALAVAFMAVNYAWTALRDRWWNVWGHISSVPEDDLARRSWAASDVVFARRLLVINSHLASEQGKWQPLAVSDYGRSAIYEENQ